MANNPNWTNEKLLKEYNKNKFELSEFNAGYLKPSKVIGGGYKSSAVAKRLAKEYLEKTVKEYKVALEIRGVMVSGGEVKWQDARIGDSARVKSENKMGIIKKDYGRKFHLKFVDGTEKTYDASELEFIKDEDDYAKGGMVVTSIKDIPNFKQILDEGKITYRGLGLGKLWDDFNKLTGTTGTRIKVAGKEYFITDEEFNTFSRGADGKLRIKFEAPFRKSYEEGGYMAKGGGVEDKFKGKNSKEVWNNLDSSTRAKVLEYLFLKEKSGNQYYDSYNSLNELSYSEWDKLPKNIKKEIENFDNGGYMAKGGETSDAEYRKRMKQFGFKPYGKTQGKYKIEFVEDGIKQSEIWESKEMAEDREKKLLKIGGTNLKVTKLPTMNMGGKVTFDDKVSSIKKSLLKKKTVSPKIQKDYGKTYNKKEALESAQRIAGAMRAKYKK